MKKNTELLLPFSPDAAENITCVEKFQVNIRRYLPMLHRLADQQTCCHKKIMSVSLAQNAIVQTHRRKPFSYQSHGRLSESLTANLWLLEQFTKAVLYTSLDLLLFWHLLLWAGCWARSAISTTWYNHSHRAEEHQNNFIHTTKQPIFTLGLAVLAGVLLKLKFVD